jgi:hypothetical protein
MKRRWQVVIFELGRIYLQESRLRCAGFAEFSFQIVMAESAAMR